MIIHTVNTNDTLTSIANTYKVSTQLIQKLNDLPNPESLVVGQKLVILIPEVIHRVQPGETLDTIARQYNITAVEIIQNNPSVLNERIYPGEDLIIAYQGQNRNKTVITNGYTYTTIDNNTLLRTLPYLTFLTIFTYGFNEKGELVEADDEFLIKTAISYGVAPIMLISTLTENGTFSNELAGFLMSEPEIQDVLIENILNVIKKKGYYGLDIDFEFIPQQYANEYAEFVSKATKRLNENGYICMVALAPKTSDTQSGLLYEAHSYSLVGNSANLALLMTYEWGYSYGPPMAVAPIPNVERVIQYGVSRIPPQKILLGVPMYGYNWPLPFIKGETMAKSLSPQEAIILADKTKSQIMFDDISQAPYFYYTENSVEHIVWFEDADSVLARCKIIKKYDLSGGGFWNINRYFPQCWTVFNYEFKIAKII